MIPASITGVPAVCTVWTFYCVGISCMNELCIYIKKRRLTVDSTSSTVWNIVIVVQIMIPTPRYYFDLPHVMDFSFGVWTILPTTFLFPCRLSQFLMGHVRGNFFTQKITWKNISGSCSCKNLQSKVPPPPVDSSYLSWLVEPIHWALNCHKYSSGTVYL